MKKILIFAAVIVGAIGTKTQTQFNPSTLQGAMEAVNALPTTPQCKAAIIMLNVNAGGAGCQAEWMKGRGTWWTGIAIGKDGTSFDERLRFLKAKGLPIPMHEITQQTWRTPQYVNQGVPINGVPSTKSWIYCQ